MENERRMWYESRRYERSTCDGDRWDIRGGGIDGV
jgi:hypothetical protein